MPWPRESSLPFVGARTAPSQAPANSLAQPFASEPTTSCCASRRSWAAPPSTPEPRCTAGSPGRRHSRLYRSGGSFLMRAGENGLTLFRVGKRCSTPVMMAPNDAVSCLCN